MSRTAVLVLGMHRSGTSLVSGLLVRLGVRAPRSLMPPSGDNPVGYWESEVLFAFHERLLRAAMTSWDAWSPVTADWLGSESAVAHGAELRSLLDHEFDSAQLFVVKDPRICRIVSFWAQNLGAAGIEPTAILTLRSPAEVALSLAARDGLARERSLLLWLRHMLDAERDTRKMSRAFVRYPDLLANWRREIDRVSSQLGLTWPQSPAEAAAEIDDLVRPDLRHHTADVGTLGVGAPLVEWTVRAMSALEALVVDPLRADAVGELDELRRELDRAARQFAGWHDADLHALRERVARLEAVRDALQARVSVLSRQHAELEEHAAHLGDKVRALDVECAKLQGQTADLERQRQGLTEDLLSAQRHGEALTASLSWRVTAPLRALARPFMRPRSDRSRPRGAGPDRDSG